jgi:hypothetical protein
MLLDTLIDIVGSGACVTDNAELEPNLTEWRDIRIRRLRHGQCGTRAESDRVAGYLPWQGSGHGVAGVNG